MKMKKGMGKKLPALIAHQKKVYFIFFQVFKNKYHQTLINQIFFNVKGHKGCLKKKYIINYVP